MSLFSFSNDETPDESESINVIAVIKARPGYESEVRTMLEALVVPSRSEDGCKGYQLHEDKKYPGSFYTYEEWTSEEKLNTHLAGAKPMFDEAEPMLDGELTIHVLQHLV